MTEIESTGGRRRGRDRQGAAGRSKLPEQKPFSQPRMTYGPTKVLSEDEVEAIHLASLKVLQDHGIDFLEPDARKLFPADGVKITDARVRFDPEFVMET
ncbi:MAG: trimethylamine methyltransferase family protein, partial [Actinomycetota bacterium]